MKKIYITLILVSICLTSVYAIEDTSTGTEMNIQPSINKQSIDDINKTSIRFCNQGLDAEKLSPRLYVESRPGQVQEICTVFFNNLETGMNFYVGFTEATKNNHDEWLCDDDTHENEFAKFVRNDFASEIINIPSNKQKQKVFAIGIPKTATGDMIGCLSYAIDGSYTKNTGDVFGIVVRKTAPIWITVTGEVYNYGRRDDIKYTYTDNKQTILKILIAILAIRLVVTIMKTGNKKDKKHTKKR